jgi:uncharacterized membrane protein HdeD (DUF308 family)
MPDRNNRAAVLAAGVKLRVEAKLDEIWWFILSRGVLALGLAVCAFVWPQQTLGILIKLLGAYLVIDGMISAIGSYRTGDTRGQFLPAIVSLAVGLVLLLWTGISAKVFLIFVGLWLVLQGIGLFLSSRRIDPVEGERGLMAAIGGIMALMGLVFVFWTDTAVVAVSWLIGIGALVIGCLLVYLAARIKQLCTRLDRIGARA